MHTPRWKSSRLLVTGARLLMAWPLIAVFVTALALPNSVRANTLEECLLEQVKSAPAESTVGALRTLCEQQVVAQPSGDVAQPGAVEERLIAEQATESEPWVLTPHKPNYILGYTYNDKLNREPFLGTDDADELKEEEVKFQFSFKFPLAYGLFGDRADLYFAYTNQSWWQLYSVDISSPFREVNHEPELFFRLKNDRKIFGLHNRLIDLGFVHQSNGRNDPVSRSWNRLFASFIFDRGNFGLGIKPWLIIGNNHDNPDIKDFLGYGDMRAAYRWRKHVFSGLLRNNLSSDNRGAIELNWSYPLYGHLRWFVQYYNGYGESLLDYNVKTERIGFGVALNDYLR